MAGVKILPVANLNRLNLETALRSTITHSIPTWWAEAIQKRGLSWWLLLLPLSGLYALGWWISRIWKAASVPAKIENAVVISVGNLRVGGSGKTPLVELVCSILARKKKVAVISRGWGRQGGGLVIVSKGRGALVDAGTGGDEPVLLAGRLPSVAVLACTDRLLAGRVASVELGAGVLVLDDGFQRRHALARDLDLLLLDAGEAADNAHLLPAGSFREPLSCAQAADAIILTGLKKMGEFEIARNSLPSPLAAKALFWARLQTAVPRLAFSSRTKRMALKGKKVGALSGLARPELFEQSLKEAGVAEIEKFRFPDHHVYTPHDLRSVAAAALALGLDAVVTTEKDEIKLKPGAWPGKPELWVLPIHMKVEPSRDFNKLIESVVLPS